MSTIIDRVNTTGLDALDGFEFPVYMSRGSRATAFAVARRCEQALDWLSGIFAQRPAFKLVVADRHDWDQVALISLYGMPHAFPGLIVTGTEPADFWRSYSDTLAPDLSSAGRQRLRSAYGDPPELGERFADLVVVHELAHLFHDYDEQSGLTDFPRLWLAELFANIALHGYVAEREPDQLPTLETICQLTWQAPPTRWPVHDLNHMEASLQAGPLNYVWFQLRLLVIARAIWQANGPAALLAFRTKLKGHDLTDSQILETINTIAPTAGNALRHWPG